MPRPADVAVAVSQLMVELALLIHDNEPYKKRNLGAALEQMFVAQLVIAETGRGNALNASEIAERLSIPRTNVLRHLKLLTENGRLRATGTRARSRYLANLELLDQAVTRDRFKRIHRAVTETSRTIRRTRPAFKKPSG